jgi:pyruvate/2-oxoglutarate/acetoin dehydrogenase E1 component/TPP-dependent pyruvate/acetoin dehydrogenase alpha subunit
MDSAVAPETLEHGQLSYEAFRDVVLRDYHLACVSRETSLLGRKEVLTGKAKFGIFGDGKEVPQVVMAKYFRKGDFYSGYYRDQTFAFATGAASVKEFFLQLYAHPDREAEPHSAGRQMNAHFATPFFDDDGNILPLARQKNLAAGMAPTSGQMPKALGLAYASKAFREVPALKGSTDLSDHGNEVCFCTIGDAATSEGQFWETINAAAVLQVPLAVFVWDDGYGISVPKSVQTAKGSISEALSGFRRQDGSNGIDIHTVKAWDYVSLCEVFEAGIDRVRRTHVPAIFHVEEVTQPQGHSTSGSHERYKSTERLAWEREWDCLRKMREWILDNGLSSEEELSDAETRAKREVLDSRQEAFRCFREPLTTQVNRALDLLRALPTEALEAHPEAAACLAELESNREPLRRDVVQSLGITAAVLGETPETASIRRYLDDLRRDNASLYNSHLHSESPRSPLRLEPVDPVCAEDAPLLNGYEILNRYFDALFAHDDRVFAFGEDLGRIGDVNQGFAGLQAKHGRERIFDTGIREMTIVGQGIGMSMRGLRPIAEIQYLDYLVYGLVPLTDDVASMHFRTCGRQAAPLIIRTRGHRLEGIWHSGSPMGMILGTLRGMHVCVPRNMVQAAGMYNTLLAGNDPGLVIECLNGYRLKEHLPENLLDMRIPLGVVETVREGTDLTVVSYGSTLRIVEEAARILEAIDIRIEIIDVRTLLPFDIHHGILASLQKTSRILFVDEDVPGGACAYMFNQVMEGQGGYRWLDVAPRTLTAKAHRPGYGSDGDFFGKPNVLDVVETVAAMMRE